MMRGAGIGSFFDHLATNDQPVALFIFAGGLTVNSKRVLSPQTTFSAIFFDKAFAIPGFQQTDKTIEIVGLDLFGDLRPIISKQRSPTLQNACWQTSP